MEKLRNEMALSKNLNKNRAMKIEEAMINTDILIGDKHALDNYAGIDTYMISDAPIGNIKNQRRAKNIYGSNVLDWEGYKNSSFTNFRTDDYLQPDSDNLYNNFSMVNLHKRPQALRSPPPSRDYKKVRTQRVGQILNHLDDILAELDYPPDIS